MDNAILKYIVWINSRTQGSCLGFGQSPPRPEEQSDRLLPEITIHKQALLSIKQNFLHWELFRLFQSVRLF